MSAKSIMGERFLHNLVLKNHFPQSFCSVYNERNTCFRVSAESTMKETFSTESIMETLPLES